MPRNTPRHIEKQWSLLEWRPRQSAVLVNKKKRSIVEVLDNPCPNCWRVWYEWHCTYCWHFPEWSEWDGVNRENSLAKRQEVKSHTVPKEKRFNPEKEISQSNPFVQEYWTWFICTVRNIPKKHENNTNYSIKFHVTIIQDGKEKKYYFQGIVRENHSIVGIQKNSERIVSSPQYFYFLVGRTNAGYMEKFLKSIPLKPTNKSA